MTRNPINTDRQFAALKPEAKRYAVRVRNEPGLYVRVTPQGIKTFAAVARDPAGQQVWATIGGAELTIEQAREQGREAIRRVKAGLPAFEPAPAKPDSFAAVAENYFKRHVEARALRTAPEIRRVLDKHILPLWRDRAFEDIRRSDVATMLDRVEDASGPRQADVCLGIVRAIMNWYAARSDYLPPLARGMSRVDTNGKKRARVLDDDELRAVWAAAEANGQFGAVIRLLLLTAQRREKVAAMKWSDIAIDGTWNVETEDREKGNLGAVVLPEAALQIIREQDRLGENPYIFPGRVGRGKRPTEGHFQGFSPCKRALDKKLSTMPPWRIHDLRRTARSLMARAGVRPDVAERVMGHTIPGVEGVYDRYDYRAEKADALKRLAALIELILADKSGENVVPIHRA